MFDATATFSTELPSTGVEPGSWVMLLPAGSFVARDGRGPYIAGDLTALRQIVARSLKYAGNTEIMVDYDHQSVFGAVPGVGGRAPAAGWVKELEARPDGIWARVEWTDTATAAIRAREYRYLSPYFSHDKTNGQVGIIASAGLSNVPALDLAGAIAARAFGDNHMDKIAEALGLAADADETSIVASIEKLKSGASALSVIAVAAGLEAAATTEMVTAAVKSFRDKPAINPGEFVPMSQFTAVRDELSSLKTSLTEDKAVKAVEAAMAAGKVAPAAKDWAMSYARSDPKGFEAFTAAQPAIATPQRPNGKPAGSEPTLDDSDLVAMRALGLTEAEMLAAKKKETT